MANPFSRGGVSRKDAKAMGDMLAGGKSSARGSIYSRMMREPQPEARLLSGIPIENRRDMERAARIIGAVNTIVNEDEREAIKWLVQQYQKI